MHRRDCVWPSLDAYSSRAVKPWPQSLYVATSLCPLHQPSRSRSIRSIAAEACTPPVQPGQLPDTPASPPEGIQTRQFAGWTVTRRLLPGMEAELQAREITWRHHVLFAVFGLAPWNITSALFAQLPLVLPASPQMAQLPSFMDVATNLGNVPMLLYLACVGRSEFARRQPQSLNAATVYTLFGIALLTAAGFSFLWNVTVADFSVFVVGFALCGGIVGDVMMVTAFPYLTQFHP